MLNQIEILKKGITEISADVIVNAANEWLKEGSGVCGAIFKAAGSKELTKACSKIGHCDTGKAVITPGFHSRAKYIIHTVGPIYNGKSYQQKQLFDCYYNSLSLANSYHCTSIVFPLISTGIYSYPVKEAWKIACNAIQTFFEDHKDLEMKVIFAVLSDSIYQIGINIIKKDEYLFFWHEYEEYGYLSQWYPSSFTIEGISYSSCEQYMMAKKALLFHDLEYYSLILKEKDPSKCKAYGKLVHNFDSDVWDLNCHEIVYNANYAKFTQNIDLKKLLIETKDKILVEASPFDNIWGIGLSKEDSNCLNPLKWKGKNQLGKILMEVRSKIQ